MFLLLMRCKKRIRQIRDRGTLSAPHVLELHINDSPGPNAALQGRSQSEPTSHVQLNKCASHRQCPYIRNQDATAN